MINGWERYSAISKLIGRQEFYIPPCAIVYQRSADYRENCWDQPKQSSVLSCNIHENLTWTTIQEIRPNHIALCCNMLIISCLDHDYCLNLCTNHQVHFLTHLITGKRYAWLLFNDLIKNRFKSRFYTGILMKYKFLFKNDAKFLLSFYRQIKDYNVLFISQFLPSWIF